MINLVVALTVEARPLVDHFSLREDSRPRGFRIFTGDDVRLIISGIGKMNAAAAVAYLHAFASGVADEAWLNIGIAGHGQFPLGQAIHAVRITDEATQRSWYPPQIVTMPGLAASVVTVERPMTNYATDSAYDMEASGFYSSAVRFATGELTQCFKIISDNRYAGTTQVTGESTETLICENLTHVEQVVSGLLHLTENNTAARSHLEEYERFLDRWHFTVSQQHQLRDLLRKWNAQSDDLVWDDELNRLPSAKAVLACLGDRLNQLPVRV